jgi:hypothetical protein
MARYIEFLFLLACLHAARRRYLQTQTRKWAFKNNLSEADKANMAKTRGTVETFTLTDKITQSITPTPWTKTREQKQAAAAAASAAAASAASAAAAASDASQQNNRKRERTGATTTAAAAGPAGGVAKSARGATLLAAEQAKIDALKAQFHIGSGGARMSIPERK